MAFAGKEVNSASLSIDTEGGSVLHGSIMSYGANLLEVVKRVAV
jgi:hypothetical protein